MFLRSIIVSALWMSLCSGCGSDGPELANVRGNVAYEGEPLAKAQVVFSPEEGDRVASAVTDEDGNYELATFVPGDGALVGKHRVTITARGPRKITQESLPPGMKESDVPPQGIPGLPTAPGDPLIPSKYFDPATSGLEREVKSGTNVFDFEIE